MILFCLSQAIVELFQVSHFSCLIGSPGITSNSVDRVVGANRELLSRADLVAEAPVCSVKQAIDEFIRLCDWYADHSDVLLVPLGPKPHVLAAILVALFRPTIGFRFPQTSHFHPVQVTVPIDSAHISAGLQSTVSTPHLIEKA
jgi:hypothetical protein